MKHRENQSDFSLRMEQLKRNFPQPQSKHFPVKAANSRNLLQHGDSMFCKAVFACGDKRFRRVVQRRSKAVRKYQLCVGKGGCNQQCYEPVYWEVPR